ncbi:hypothetical protein ACFS2C_11210 [Prauserella oleivorans]|uniref:Uncharacterized protein n=1 Tax=Prauserella oleivorans TaxID=1478153 RepID=A0ABW5WC88_9PSEU
MSAGSEVDVVVVVGDTVIEAVVVGDDVCGGVVVDCRVVVEVGSSGPPEGRSERDEVPVPVPGFVAVEVGVMTVVVGLPSGPTLTTVVGEVDEAGMVPVTATPSTTTVVRPGIAWPGTNSGPPVPPPVPWADLDWTPPADSCAAVPPVTCATAPNAVASTRPLAASAM